ncbi:hypothetical protein ACWX0K_15305 [Nitrobacteraceae bacterium UC4446_H13]
MTKLYYAAATLLMVYMTIQFGHDWYVGAPADWVVWFFAITAAISSGCNTFAKWMSTE